MSSPIEAISLWKLFTKIEVKMSIFIHTDEKMKISQNHSGRINNTTFELFPLDDIKQINFIIINKTDYTSTTLTAQHAVATVFGFLSVLLHCIAPLACGVYTVLYL